MTKPGPELMSERLSFKLTASLRDALTEEATRRGMYVGELIRTVLSGFIAHIDKEDQ